MNTSYQDTGYSSYYYIPKFGACQEGFLNIQELRGEANLSQGWGIQAFPSLAFQYSDKYPLPSYEPYGKSDCLQVSLFNMDLFMFCKSGILIFIFAESNYLVKQYICPHHVD